MRNSKLLATGFAFALVVASSITVRAAELDSGFHGTDGGVYDEDCGWSSGGSNPSLDISFDENYSEPTPAESYNEPSYDSGFHGTEGGVYDEDCGWYSGVSSSNSTSSSSSDSTASYSAPAPAKSANDVTVSAGDGQKFRIVMNTEHTTYQVYHCGISRATFAVADADGNAVKYSNIKLEKGEDNLWYANITFPKDVDTTGYTVTATKGDPGYLSTTLNVKGIKVNGVLALSTLS